MNLDIHEVRNAEFDAVADLFHEGDDYHREAMPELFRPESPVRTEEFLKSFIGNDDARIFVAVLDGEVIGLVQFSVIDTGDRPTMFSRKLVFVDSLVVRTQYRRQGVGKTLMSYVQDWAAEHDIPNIELTVYGFNRAAIQLYEDLGYETMMRRMRFKVE